MEAKPNKALKIALVNAELTSREAARKARIPETRFSAIANGRLIPNRGEQARIARVLSTTVDHLFSEEVSA